MPLIKRRFFIQCIGEECFKLAELIREKAPLVEQMDIMITDKGLYITMYGYKSDIRNAWKYVQGLVTSYKSAVTEQGGYRRVKIDYLVEKIGHTFPPRLLAEILKLMGYSTEYDRERNEIRTSAPLDKIEEIVKRIISIMESIKFDVSGTTSKYYVIASSILSNLPINEVYEKGLEFDHLYVDEDGKYRIKLEWRRALEDFLRRVKQSVVKEGK